MRFVYNDKKHIGTINSNKDYGSFRLHNTSPLIIKSQKSVILLNWAVFFYFNYKSREVNFTYTTHYNTCLCSSDTSHMYVRLQ